jgi:hypothetical protein
MLTAMLQARDAKLEEAGDLHRFLKDLDHFQAWLTKTESGIANEDTPSRCHCYKTGLFSLEAEQNKLACLSLPTFFGLVYNLRVALYCALSWRASCVYVQISD